MYGNGAGTGTMIILYVGTQGSAKRENLKAFFNSRPYPLQHFFRIFQRLFGFFYRGLCFPPFCIFAYQQVVNRNTQHLGNGIGVDNRRVYAFLYPAVKGIEGYAAGFGQSCLGDATVSVTTS
jgi:hypothetical protein